MGIARLWLLCTGMLWVVCWSGRKAYGQQGVGLSLSSMSLTNNSIVTNTDIGTGAATLVCTTTYTPCCTSANQETQWYFPNGSQALNNPTNLPYRRTRGQSPGRVILNRNSDTTTTGIFHCDIPNASGALQSLYVGIYDMSTGTSTATTLVYSETTRSLTCTSTGGPATTVTWRKDGAVITINATYQQTQVVTDPVTGTYQTVLTIDQSVTDVFGTYSCTVGNIRGTSAAIETTISSLLVSITLGANPTASQSYTFTCTVTPQGGLTGTPIVQWRGPGGSDPITTGGDFTVSSTTPYTLTINPLQQSRDGQYTCQATIGTTTGSSSATLTVEAPSVSVVITPTGTAVVGQLDYSLSCSVSGADSLSPTITYCWYNESSNPRSQVGTTSTYSFTRLRPYHAGQYACEVNVASPYLNEDLSQSMMQDITLQIPVPTVGINPPGVASAYAGSQLTLTCSIVLDFTTLFPVLGDLVVSSVWSDPGSGMLSSDGRITVSPASQQGISTAFISTVVFNTLRTSDAGTYTCEATVAPRGSTAGTVTNGVGSANEAIATITNPTIQFELTSNTTRLPNTAPYNTFSLTCTATVPQGVVSPKTFTWRRRIGPQMTPLTPITDNGGSILITSTNLDQPTSTSVLTVRETTAGDYRYRCRGDLSELTVGGTIDVYPINVTGPANPVQPQNLMDISTRHDRATVQWSVPYIAYTPETFTVNYGHAMNSLDMSVTATQRGDNFTIPSQPFMFSVELTGLDPGVTYYYQVEATNSEGPTLSTVQQFTSNELTPTPPQMFRITAVTTTSLSFSWQEPANPNGDITGYQLSCQPLLLGIPTPQPLSPGPTARMAVLADLHPGVRYNCSIAAMNMAGPSPLVYTDDSTAEVAPTGPPLNFMVIPGARSMIFSWAPPNATQRNGVITGYSLSCTPLTAEGDITMQYTQVGTFTLGEFTPATTYSCSIFASNSQGDGPMAFVNIPTEEDSPDAAPQSVMFQHDRDSPEMVFFSWQPPPPDQQNGEITRYDIVCTPSGGSGELVNGMSDGALNAAVGMFTPATQYSCTITASTSAGTGPGNAVTVVTLPAAPENVTLTNSFSLLRVMWTNDPPNGVISHYTIYVTRLERGNTVLTNTSMNTQFDIPEGALDPYELVSVSVSASNSAGEGARSPGVRGRTREQPPGIVGCPPGWTDLTSAIQVDWTAPLRPNGIILRYYLVLTNFGGNNVIASTIVNSNVTLTTDFTAGLDDGVPYTVQIFAENSAGNGTVCNVTDFTNELEPPAPSGVSVTRVSETVIRVMWQRLSLVEAQGHIRYRVMVTSTTTSKRKRQTTQGERMCTLMSQCEVPANESSVLVGGLDQDTSYSVTVVAVNGENEVGSTSAPLIATPVQPTTGTSVVGIIVGIVVGFVVVIIVLVVIMGAVIGVLITRNRRYQLSMQEHAGKDQPVKWSAVTKSGDADITITQCEAYGLADFGHEYEEIPTSGMTSQPPNPEYEIPTAQCPAYIPTSQQKERVEEGEYETV